MAFKIQLLIAILTCLWYIVGSYAFFGMSYSAYIFKSRLPELGYNSDGYCIDSTKCDPSLRLEVSKVINALNIGWIIGFVIGAIINCSITWYYHQVSKRLLALWG